KVLNLTGSAEAGSTVQVHDGANLLGIAVAGNDGAWTFTTDALVDGNHSLTATATDAAGNTGAISSAFDVTVDSAAPNAPVITSFGNDTGMAGDGVTSAKVLNVTGSAEAGSTVQVYDGANLLGTAVAGNDGAWTFTTDPLAD